MFYTPHGLAGQNPQDWVAPSKFITYGTLEKLNCVHMNSSEMSLFAKDVTFIHLLIYEQLWPWALVNT